MVNGFGGFRLIRVHIVNGNCCLECSERNSSHGCGVSIISLVKNEKTLKNFVNLNFKIRICCIFSRSFWHEVCQNSHHCFIGKSWNVGTLVRKLNQWTNEPVFQYSPYKTMIWILFWKVWNKSSLSQSKIWSSWTSSKRIFINMLNFTFFGVRSNLCIYIWVILHSLIIFVLINYTFSYNSMEPVFYSHHCFIGKMLEHWFVGSLV